MNARRVTLAQVAAKAGVHVTTVSLALRNSTSLPETTKKRIRALAAKMGYQPDPLMRALVSYRSNLKQRVAPPTVAYVTNWTSRWGWQNATGHREFHAGAEAATRELGYHLEHFWVGEPGLSPKRLSRMLTARGINGLILASHARGCGDTLDFDWDRFSAVKIDYLPHQPVLHNVASNLCDMVQLATKKAVAGGFRRIGFVMHRGWDHALNSALTAGFLCEQQHFDPDDIVPGLIFPERSAVNRWFNEKTSVATPDPAAFARWLQEYKPDVIISKASFVLPLLKDLKLKIPRDLAFVDLWLDRTDGTTAGVRQNYEAIGATAMEALDRQLLRNRRGVPEIAITSYVEGTWFDGLSCPMPTTRFRSAQETNRTKAS